MPTPTLRRASRDDAGPLSELIAPLAQRFVVAGAEAAARAFLDTVAPRSIARYVTSPDFIYLVAVDGAEIVGAAAIRQRSHLFHLFVAQAWQRQGLGRRLWESARDSAIAAGNAGSFTVNAVRNAVPVYERFGFRVTGPLVQRDGIVFVPMRMDCLTRR